MNQKYRAFFTVSHDGEQHFARVELGKNGTRHTSLTELIIEFPISSENRPIDFPYADSYCPITGDDFNYDPKTRIARILAALEIAAQEPIISGIEKYGTKKFSRSVVFEADDGINRQHAPRGGEPIRARVNSCGAVYHREQSKRLAS